MGTAGEGRDFVRQMSGQAEACPTKARSYVGHPLACPGERSSPLALRLTVAIFVLAALALAQDFDVVIANGRVMDPASGMDAVRNVGIREGKIAAISADALHGRTVLDATGLIVAPGFIDLHSHGQTPENYRYKAMDGVTTALEMEVGVSPVSAWYAAREGKALVNFGATSGHLPARMAVMHDTGALLPRDKAVEQIGRAH